MLVEAIKQSLREAAKEGLVDATPQPSAELPTIPSQTTMPGGHYTPARNCLSQCGVIALQRSIMCGTLAPHGESGLRCVLTIQATSSKFYR